jgi:hypothetical protein
MYHAEPTSDASFLLIGGERLQRGKLLEKKKISGPVRFRRL